MKQDMITGDIAKVLISEEEITERVAQLGEQISRDYQGRDVLMVSVLKGAFIFMADLARSTDIHINIDFMAVSSYGGGTKTTGVVRVLKDLDVPLDGKDILIVEDILDSGKTLSYLKEMLEQRNPSSIKICTLLDKPERRESPVTADYVGFVVPDEFVVGYGLDYDERYRNLRYIGVLKPAVYTK